MPRDFLPDNDNALDSWLQQFVAVLASHHGRVGISAAEVAECAADHDALGAALEDFTAKQNAARAATVAKDAAHAKAAANVRALARRIQNAPGIDDTLRRQLGLTVPRPRVRRLAPVTPTGLGVSVLPGGRTLLRWDRGDNRPGVTFMVEGRGENAEAWRMVGFSTKTRLIPADAAPGVAMRYRVRALRGELVSPPTESVVAWPG